MLSFEEIHHSLWNIYADMYMYTDKVCIESELSQTIREKRGIHQGGLTSTEIVKARTNPTANIP